MNVLLNEYPDKIQMIINNPSQKEVTDTSFTLLAMLRELGTESKWTTIVISVEALPNISVVLNTVARLLAVKPLLDSVVKHTYMYIKGEKNKNMLQRIAAMNNTDNISFITR